MRRVFRKPDASSNGVSFFPPIGPLVNTPMKKILRVLLVLMVLLSPGSLGVQAQAAPTALAYLPLLSHSAGSVSPEGSIPGSLVQLHTLDRQAYDRLAPALMQARQNGLVVRFAPDFLAGLVMVEYVAGTNLASRLGSIQPVFATPQAVLGYTQSGAAMKNALPAAAAASPYMYLYQNSCSFFGGNLGAGDTYRAYLKDTSGRLVANTWGTLNNSGGFNDCFGGLWGGIAPGFSFTFKVYSPSGNTLLHTYATTVARIDITSIDISAKIVKGTAPAYSMLTMELFHPKLDSTGGETYTGMYTKSSNAGAWQANFGTAAMRGGDEVDGIWSKPATIFFFDACLFAPVIDCSLGGNWCQSSGIPAASASLFFKHGGNTYTYTGMFDAKGWFGASLHGAHMTPIFLKAGDQAGGTGVTTLTLPSLTATPNAASDTVTGAAPANRWFTVELDKYDPGSGGWYEYKRWVHANAAGNYSASFSGSVDITAADQMNLFVYFINPATGDETYYERMIAP